ncbi:MAG: DNA repair protein RecN [Acidobacteriota bacterium]
MLRELHIRNLAVVESTSLEFEPGLTVLTGETGAGKSIVVDSLGLAAGSRADSDLIRTGSDSLSVIARFQPAGEAWREILAAAGVEAEGEDLLIRREISRSGRNRVYVNDQPTTLRLLAELAPTLLRIHGQRDELGLIDPELQRAWLDLSGGSEAAERLRAVETAYGEWHELTGGLDRLSGDEAERSERLDLLSFQAAEIEAARVSEGEDEALRQERDVLRNAEAIVQALAGSYDLLFEGDGAAVDRLGTSEGLLERIEQWEPAAADWLKELLEVRTRLEEVTEGMRRRLDGLEADPARLDEVEERLALLERLLRKHRAASCGELLERCAAMRREIEQLTAAEENRAALEEEASKALRRYEQAALALSAGRREWGEQLARSIEGELSDLGLEKARLGVDLERRPRADSPLTLSGEAFDGGVDFGPQGIDQVVFQFAPNPGEEERPLSVIASGGELSRIYLALQLAAPADRASTDPVSPGSALVFDEVDTGIGGAQAAALGRKLRRLGASSQVLVVTHLPQVASFGHHHFRIQKTVEEERTRTRVQVLDEDARVAEVARMLGGEATTDLTLSHARELVAQGTGAPAEKAKVS